MLSIFIEMCNATAVNSCRCCVCIVMATQQAAGSGSNASPPPAASAAPSWTPPFQALYPCSMLTSFEGCIAAGGTWRLAPLALKTSKHGAEDEEGKGAA